MKISHKNRKIGYTYGSTSGKFMFRNKKIILFESLLEKSFLQVLEFNDIVLDVVEQPFTIETQITKGNKGSYTPDFLIYFKEPELRTTNPIKPIVAEVKPSKKLIQNRIELKQKFKSAIKFCNEQEFRFKIFNENRIRSTEVDNIVFLNRYKDYKPDHYNKRYFFDTNFQSKYKNLQNKKIYILINISSLLSQFFTQN